MEKAEDCKELEKKPSEALPSSRNSVSVKRTTIVDLPDYILIRILSLLNNVYLATTVRNVCQKWREVADSEDFWLNYDFIVGFMSKTEIIHCLKNMPSLRVFIDHCPRRNAEEIMLTAISCCKKLKVFDVPYSRMSPKVMKALNDLKNLKELGVLISPDDIELIKTIGEIKTLTDLNLVQRDVANLISESLEPITSGCPNLNSISLNNINPDPRDLNNLLARKNHILKKFLWRGPMHSSTLQKVGDCSELILLHLNDFFLVDIDEYSGNIPDPELKNLSYMVYEDSHMHILPFILCNSFNSLSSLQIISPKISADASLKIVLHCCVNLQELLLEKIEFTGSVLFDIRCKNLKCFAIIDCTEWDFRFLSVLGQRCKKLQSLFIAYFKLSIYELTEISEFLALEDLTFRSCDLTEFNIDLYETGLPGLKNISIPNCCFSENRKKFMRRLKKARPNINVHLSDY